MGRRGYPPEFRRRVLELLAAGRRVTDLARNIGVSGQTIYTWRRQEAIDRGLVPGLTSAGRAELTAANRDRITATSLAGAQPGSAAATDEASPLGHHVRIMAIDNLMIGLDHLVIWHRLLTAAVQPNASHITLIHGAMEGAVTCRWLIDPRVDSVGHVRRGVALLLEDYGNRDDFERDLGIADAIKPPR